MVFLLMYLEMAVYAALGFWMLSSVWKASRGDHRTGDPARLVIASFCLLIIYRDWRIVFVDANTEAKIVMCVLGIALAGYTAIVAKGYGRGPRIS